MAISIGDGKVDAADYVDLAQRWGSPTPFSSADYNTWRANFGAGTAGSGSSVGGAAVPEPASVVLGLLAITALWPLRRRS